MTYEFIPYVNPVVIPGNAPSSANPIIVSMLEVESASYPTSIPSYTVLGSSLQKQIDYKAYSMGAPHNRNYNVGKYYAGRDLEWLPCGTYYPPGCTFLRVRV